ncbi:IclR family transcriptional regulator [Pseudonocardia xishanensis]|uniref:IclR family transcriptional regulator n=1 Tax=Pseudonocardia xishanensis TaxID=630995 RepID=A0ABP8RZW9_9PSEU
MPSDKRIQSVANASRLLLELAAVNGPIRLNDLSARLGMNKSSVHLLLSTLADAGFVEQTADATYRLGLALFEVGTAALQQYGLGARLAPPMEALAEQTREAVTLGVLHQDDVLLVQRFESDQVLRASIRVGSRMPLHSSASGRAILAFLPEDERRRRLTATGIGAVTTRQVLARMQEIRDAGYETQQDEWAVEVSSIAVPVFGLSGAPVAALSVSSPSVRFAPDGWVAPLVATGEQLTILIQQMSMTRAHLARIAP